MDRSIDLYLVTTRHQEMRHQASLERLARVAVDLQRHGLGAVANLGTAAIRPEPSASAIPARAS